MSEIKYFFSIEKLFSFFACHSASVTGRTQDHGKIFFWRIVLNRVSSDAEFHTDSKSHIKSWKHDEYTWIRARKSKKWASIYSLCLIRTNLWGKCIWYSDSTSNSASVEDRVDTVQKEKFFNGLGVLRYGR